MVIKSFDHPTPKGNNFRCTIIIKNLDLSTCQIQRAFSFQIGQLVGKRFHLNGSHTFFLNGYPKNSGFSPISNGQSLRTYLAIVKTRNHLYRQGHNL